MHKRKKITSLPLCPFELIAPIESPLLVLEHSLIDSLIKSLSRLKEIDGRALLLMTQEMLESLTENKLGPMTKIQSAVKALKQAWGIWNYSFS